MHCSLILKNTSHQSRKNTKHFIHLSDTWICIKAATNKTKFKLSCFLWKKCWPFRKSQMFVTGWTSNSGCGTFAWGIFWRARLSVVHLLRKPCVSTLSMALSLSSRSLYFSKFIDFNMPSANLSAHSEEYFSFENRWYGNLLNIRSVKPKLQINVNFSWTCEKIYKLILKNTLRTDMFKKVFIIGFISINWIW